MTSCNSEEEFESTWQKMMNEYKLHDHVWLSNMYKIRHKWSTAFSKDVFSADIKSSKRSESTNSALGEIVGKTTSLAQFLLSFEKMVDHPSNTMSLNASIAKSALYRPQMASTVMPLVWPQIPQSLHEMQPVRPPPIRPPISNGSQFMNASQLVETVQMTQLSQVHK
ncbi:FAR1-related protein [Sesbania bispinosa]|nr:FAR1-related protein [Sesbania bispinosa]